MDMNVLKEKIIEELLDFEEFSERFETNVIRSDDVKFVINDIFDTLIKKS